MFQYQYQENTTSEDSVSGIQQATKAQEAKAATAVSFPITLKKPKLVGVAADSKLILCCTWKLNLRSIGLLLF